MWYSKTKRNEKMRKFYLQFRPQIKVIGFYPAKNTKTWVWIGYLFRLFSIEENKNV